MDDILPDGYRVKKGDGVYYLAYAMGRMPYIWGGDAEEFRPERWLKNGIFQPESPFKFIAFHVRIIFLLQKMLLLILPSISVHFFCKSTIEFIRSMRIDLQKKMNHKLKAKVKHFLKFSLSVVLCAGWSSNLSRKGVCLQANENSFNCSSSVLPVQIS